MGICAGRETQGTKEEQKISQEIEQQLREEKRRQEVEIKILLLGLQYPSKGIIVVNTLSRAGESGKSTFAKQIRILHLKGYDDNMKKEWKLMVQANVVTATQYLIKIAAASKKEFSDSIKDAVKFLQELQVIEESEVGVIHKRMRALVDDATSKSLLKNHKTLYAMPDSSPYFLENLDRIFSENFVPTIEDIVRTRLKTIGAHEISFKIGSDSFRLVDVGGQRSERRKWLPLFTDVTAIIFFASLNEYNQRLEEDKTVNRMQESLQLFTDIINNEWLSNVAVILFLNKHDLFQEKIKNVDLNVCFPEYEGGKNSEVASKYILNKYLDTNKNKGVRKVYPFVTVATDTKNIDHVFSACKDIIVSEAIRADGLVQ